MNPSIGFSKEVSAFAKRDDILFITFFVRADEGIGYWKEIEIKQGRNWFIRLPFKITHSRMGGVVFKLRGKQKDYKGNTDTLCLNVEIHLKRRMIKVMTN